MSVVMPLLPTPMDEGVPMSNSTSLPVVLPVKPRRRSVLAHCACAVEAAASPSKVNNAPLSSVFMVFGRCINLGLCVLLSLNNRTTWSGSAGSDLKRIIWERHHALGHALPVFRLRDLTCKVFEENSLRNCRTATDCFVTARCKKFTQRWEQNASPFEEQLTPAPFF